VRGGTEPPRRDEGTGGDQRAGRHPGRTEDDRADADQRAGLDVGAVHQRLVLQRYLILEDARLPLAVGSAGLAEHRGPDGRGFGRSALVLGLLAAVVGFFLGSAP
jgi:hypothetical protein